MESRTRRGLPPGWAVMLTALAALAILGVAPKLEPRATGSGATAARDAAGPLAPPTSGRLEPGATPPASAPPVPSKPARERTGASAATVPVTAGSTETALGTPAPNAPATRSLAVTPVSAVPSQRWSTSGFLAAGASTSATYAIPAGLAGRELQLTGSGNGAILATGCGLEHAAGRGVVVPPGGCGLELQLSGPGPVSFTLAEAAG